jgi:hypothetical protein
VDDPHDRLFQLTEHAPGVWGSQPDASRRRWLRAMLALLGATCLAFGLTALWLSRLSAQSSIRTADSQAIEVVQAHFAALHRGDYRAAYALFSTRLRHEMPFPVFHQIMEAHQPLLEGKPSVFPETTSARRVVVDIAFHGAERMDMTAELTLVRSGGHWWIDDVHWSVEQTQPQRVSYA